MQLVGTLDTFMDYGCISRLKSLGRSRGSSYRILNRLPGRVYICKFEGGRLGRGKSKGPKNPLGDRDEARKILQLIFLVTNNHLFALVREYSSAVVGKANAGSGTQLAVICDVQGVLCELLPLRYVTLPLLAQTFRDIVRNHRSHVESSFTWVI